MPYVGSVTTDALSGLPSESESLVRTLPETGVSSGVVTVSSTAVGAAFERKNCESKFGLFAKSLLPSRATVPPDMVVSVTVSKLKPGWTVHSQLSFWPLLGPELFGAAQASVVSPGLELAKYGALVS